MTRRRRILAAGLILVLATCVDHRAPTSSETEAVAEQPVALTTATITHTLLTAGHDPTNTKVYTTASIAPAANALITVAILTHRSSGAAPEPSLSGGGMSTWDVVATTTYNGATPLDRVTILRAMSPSPGSGPITITMSATVSNCQWIVSQWDGVETSGANGAGAIAQSDVTSGTAVTGLAVTLASFADAGNVGYGVFGLASATPAATEGSGFTRIDEQPSGEGTTGDLFAEWAPGQNVIDATWSSLSAGALGVELVAGGGGGGGSGVSAAKSTVAAAPSSISADGATSTITVTALDANDAPLSGLAVVLTVSGTGNTVSAIGPTDANGQATATLSSTVAEQKTVSAKIDGTSITQTATVTVTPGAVDKDQSTVAAAPTTIVPGSGVATITVTAKDAHGNPIQNATVDLLTTGSAILTQPANPTDAKGEATGTLSSNVEETVTVSAKIAGTTITQTAAVTVMSVPVSVDLSTLVASPTTIDPGFGDATITVTAKDGSGNPISGANVQLLTTGSAVLTQPAYPTDANGVATGTVYSSIEETVTISAKINGVLITQTATVQITTHPEEAIVQTLLTSGHDVVNQKVYTTATIAPAPNALVTVAVLMRRSSGALSPTVSGGGMPMWEPVASVDFDTQGVPTKRLLIFRALTPTPGSGPITITFPSSVSNCQWIVSQWLGVDASGTNGSGAIAQAGQAASDGATALTVSLAAFANPGDLAYGVTGVAVNGPTVNPATGFTEIAEESSEESSALEAEWGTNLSTVGTGWSTLTKAGMLAVEIRAGVAGPVEPVATVEVSPPSASVVVGSTVQLTASTLDVGGEPLYGRPITWMSDAPGIASVSSTGLVTGISVGTTTITATSEDQSGTSSVTVTATAAPVASVEVTPASTSIPVGGIVQLTATPKDGQGQPLSGRTIAWETDAPSIATVSSTGLVTGQSTGSAVITATSEGQSGTSSVTVTSGGTEALVGQWSAVMPAPIVEVHQHLLLDGKVLTFGENGPPQVFDPATGIFTAVPSPSLLFCGGHDFLQDGRLLVTGGGTGNGKGLPNTNIFDPSTDSWIVLPNMAQGRWYPTNTMLPDGRMLTVAGQDENGVAEPIPEVWDGTSWRQLTGASLTLPNYPRDFLAPDGRIFDAGPSATSHWLDFSGTGSWTDGPRMNYGSRSYGSAVMYDVGKILYAGGNSTPTNTAEVIDLNQPSPQWTYTGSMALSRWNLNATVLPDGQVLVTGGVNGDRSDPTLAVDAAEMWNPATGLWTTMASAASLLRGYHSTSLLLPDGRVIHSGGGDGGGTVDNFNYQIYSPPYLFKGARPSVTGMVGTPAYGQGLTVQTPDGASITKVTLIRFGSVTHAFDQGQRLVSLSFSAVSGGVSVTLPSSRTVAPPGPYMMFLVNGNGVPSIGRIVVLQ